MSLAAETRYRSAWRSLADRARDDNDLWTLVTELDSAVWELVAEGRVLPSQPVDLSGRAANVEPVPPPNVKEVRALEELGAAHRLDQKRRGLSEGYIKEQHYVVDKFAAWLFPRSLLEAQQEDVEAWLDTLDIGLEARRNYIGHLNMFYVFVRDRTGHPAPTEKIRPPKQTRTLPRPIRDEHLRLAIDRSPDPVMTAWLLLAAYEGLRCQEIAGLDVEDVDVDLGQLRIRRGKGRKQRELPLHPEVLVALEKLPLPAWGVIFTASDGQRVPPWRVSQRINTYLHSVEIPSTAHTLRHWFATRLYQSTTDLRLVQETLGHSSPITTQIYAAVDQTKKAPAVMALTVGGGD